MNLTDKRILVTGGSLGIGKAIARSLIAGGAKVAITARDETRVRRAAEEMGAHAIVADVSVPADIERTYDDVLGRFDGLDVLVNNAGIGTFSNLEGVTLDEFENVFGVNVYGAALMAARAVPIFKKQGSGHIINIGSTAGLKGYEGGTVYSASKFALRAMTYCWQAELRRHNIRTILIAPSEVATAFGSENRTERQAPPNKLTPDEIAHAVRTTLEMDDRGMIPELSVWATNPW